MILLRRCFTKINMFLNIYMNMPYMYLMINVIHTDVLKFIEQIFSINSVLFECIHIYYKFVYYFII